MQVDRPARQRRKPRAAPGGPKGLKARQQGALPAATSHARLRGLRSAGTAAYELSRQGFRPWTTYKRPGKALCLLEPPAPFQQPETQPSNPCTVNINVTRRLNRVFMQNIGPGPLWELLEDCAWWKESVPPPDSIWTQQHLRPTVYLDLKISSKEWSMLNSDEARLCLPHGGSDASEEPPSISCLFGPFGEQSLVQLPMLATHDISQYFPKKTSVVFNAGAGVFGLDWCPTFVDASVENRVRYLAVAPAPSRDYKLAVGIKRSCPSSIQIWSLRPPEEDEDKPLDLRCSLLLCAHYGPAIQLKWCPLPCDDADPVPGESMPKIGLLAATFTDGSLCVFAVPNPQSFGASEYPVAILAERPLARLELEDTSCWCFDWANSDTLAVGCSNGSILVTKLSAALKRRRQDETAVLLPTHYIPAHQSAVRTVCWIRLPRGTTPSDVASDPTVIVSGGFDGKTLITDIRDQRPILLNRSRDIIMDVVFSNILGVPITIDFGNVVKLYCIVPSLLGQGQSLLESEGPIWSLATSDYHPQLASGGADGSCVTTNIARAAKRGISAPFFYHKIYQLDYSRKTGVFRMLENFVPKAPLLRVTTVSPEDDAESVSATTKKKAGTETVHKDDYRVSGSWPKEVCVTRVAWDSGGGISSAPFLASGTASGLCRIDWLMGRFYNERLNVDKITSWRNHEAAAGDWFDGDEEDDELDA
ncbi:hypothetical protein EXIGLDRAFT_749456 [Exidia glandulosa HHB12029]|uniref:WD40 repeat-like protein n=1 Tax=Exidia glandulosa HHB12029 TaxID=1314781 RepID=A0A165I4U4_EXIGL|nr:hypothetical protein EXIGLDRAFT_749456 [Exidia glandulosa HHB12029]